MHQQVLASINFSNGLSNAFSSVANFVPKFIGFLVILVIGWFVARVIARVLDSVLRRIGFEKVAERGGVNRMLADSGYDATKLICKVVYYALLLVTLQLGFGVFGPNPISTMINGVVAWLPRGIVAVVIMIVAAAIARVVKDLVSSALSSLSYGNTLGTVAAAFILVLGAVAALGQAGIATAVTGPVLYAILATVVGIAIVGVGGGMIMPMRERWERMLTHAEREVQSATGNADAYGRGHSDAMAGQAAGTPSTVAAGGRDAGMSGGSMGTGSVGSGSMGGSSMSTGMGGEATGGMTPTER